MSRKPSCRTFLKSAAPLAAAGAIGLPELGWREAWAGTSAGLTTVNRTIVGTGGTYQRMAYGPGEPYLLREDIGVTAQPGRASRRTSLLYFAQLSDTHVLDAQSPGRVEYLDIIPPAARAFRAQEMLTPFVLDSMVRRLNVLRSSELSGASLAFTINTGDTIDNLQYNELRWVIDILDGGPMQPLSGGPLYEGVQRGNTVSYYYHPDQPSLDSYGSQHGFPAYPGLLDSAELPFSAAGIQTPWYTVFGNHDGLVQGTVPVIPLLQRIAIGSVKIISLPFGPAQRQAIARALLRGNPDPWRQVLEWSLANRGSSAIQIVTPDPNRRLLSHQEWINEHFTTRGQPVGHGFTGQNVEANTGYYMFGPTRSIHCIVLDTCSPGGGADGNLDQTQYDWLAADLAAHAGMLTLIFAHHTIATMDNDTPRPGDPHPVLLGADLEQLFWANPSVVAFVNGHAHRHEIIPHPHPNVPGDGFWEITTAAHIDWPEQSRLIELFDNHDGTLSIFGTIVDHEAAPDTPSLTSVGLATLSRELSFNDPQFSPTFGPGAPQDRNVELILRRPV